MIERIENMLRMHEGERLKVYRCPSGKLTIGVGRNLEDRGISADESTMLLRNDIRDFRRQLQAALPWMDRIDVARQAVLIDMAFNMGVAGLLTFKKTLEQVEKGRYRAASVEMLNSRWAIQVGHRAVRLSEMMETGRWPEGVA